MIDSARATFRCSRRALLRGGLGVSASVALTSLASRSVLGASSPLALPQTTATVQILVGFGTGNAPTQLPIQQELAATYSAAHPHVAIEYVRVPNSTEAARKLTTAIAGGQPPDIVLPAGRYGVFLFADQDVWVNLGPRFQQAGLSLDIYPPPVQAAAQAIGYYNTPGNLIGIPAGYHVHALAYNKDLFARAGVPEPPKEWNTPEWTYEQLREVAMQLTLDASGKHAGQPGFDPNAIVQWGLGHFFPETAYFAFGGRLYDPASKRAQFDQPGGIAGLQFAADLANRDHALLTDVLAKSVGGEGGQLFLWQSGRIAMVDMCSCDLASYGNVSSFAWDLAAMPRGPRGPFNFLNVDVGALVKQGKQQELAWDVAKTLLLDEPQATRLQVESYGAIPSRTDQLPVFKGHLSQRFPGLDAQVFLDAIPYAGGDNEDWLPNFAQVNALKSKAFDMVMLGQATAADALSGLQTEAQEAIDEWLATHQLPSS